MECAKYTEDLLCNWIENYPKASIAKTRVVGILRSKKWLDDNKYADEQSEEIVYDDEDDEDE